VDLDDELRKLFADERLDVRVRPEADRVIVTGARRIRRRRAGVVFGGGMLSMAAMLVAGTAFGVSGDAPHQVPLAVAADTSGPTITTTPPPATTSTTTAASVTTVESTARTTARPSSSKAKPTTTTSTPTSTLASVLAFGPTTVLGLRLGMTTDEAMATGLVKLNPMAPTAAGCIGYDWAGGAGTQPNALIFSSKYGLVRIGGRGDAATPEGIHDGSSAADVRVAYPLQTTPQGSNGDWVAPVPGNPNAHYWIIFSGSVVSDLRLELAVQDCDP